VQLSLIFFASLFTAAGNVVIESKIYFVFQMISSSTQNAYQRWQNSIRCVLEMVEQHSMRISDGRTAFDAYQ
jgi:hypothetical protein